MFMCMGLWPACVFVRHAHSWCQQRPEDDVGYLGNGVIDGWELPCGCWEWTRVLWKSSQRSYLLSHLSSPVLSFLTVTYLLCVCVSVHAVGARGGQGTAFQGSVLSLLSRQGLFCFGYCTEDREFLTILRSVFHQIIIGLRLQMLIATSSISEFPTYLILCVWVCDACATARM